MRNNKAWLTLVLLYLSSSLAHAAVQPPTDEEMLEQCDVHVKARVSEVVCDGPKQENDKGVFSNYIATFDTIEVLKGEPGNSFQVPFTIAELNSFPQSCSWTEPMHRTGEIKTIYLSLKEDGFYQTLIWSNTEYNGSDGAEQLPSCDGTTEIPEDTGSTVGKDAEAGSDPGVSADLDEESDTASPLNTVDAAEESDLAPSETPAENGGCTGSPRTTSSSFGFLALALAFAFLRKQNSTREVRSL